MGIRFYNNIPTTDRKREAKAARDKRYLRAIFMD